MASSSLSRPSKYDVFLSFRGEDTRKSFVSHLYRELDLKGIRTFKDDEELERGSSISPELQRAIDESRCCIVVISRNYAASGWCLDELVKIIKCQEEGSLMVIPIFYEVDPSHVRKQTGNFAEDFSRHEEKWKGNPEKVRRWKEALTKVANIAGEDSRNWTQDSNLIQKIVREVSSRLFSGLSRDFSHLVGMEAHMKELDRLLCLQSSEVRMIGIWGMAGIGKTTLASFLYEQLWPQFHSYCYIEDVKKTFRNHSLSYLQEQLLSQLLHGEVPKIRTLEHGFSAIKARLAHRKVLIILDDVDTPDQLDAVAKETNWFGPESRIIITTRDKHLLSSHGVELVYEVKCLSVDDARQLFNQSAFKRKHLSYDFLDLSIRFVWFAGGLPLSLKVLGSSLCGRSKKEWKSALARLKRTPPKGILDVVKVSYDGLDVHDKDVFLCIACFFRGEKVDRVTECLETSGYSAGIGIQVLIEQSLIDVTSGRITMHDMVHQMGRELVRQQSINDPGKRRFLWDPAEICDVLTDNTGTEAIEGMVLNMSEITELCVSDRAFENMSNLSFLKFYKHVYDRKVRVHLPAGITYSCCKPNFLYWDAFPLKTICFDSKCLVELHMRESKLENLWEGTPRLRNLRMMDLSRSMNLKNLPDLSEAKNLKELIMEGCLKLEFVPTSIKLKRLKVLNLEGCSSLKEFPEASGSTKEIILQGTAIEEVPETVRHLTGLVTLNMADCKKLRNLSNTIGNLTALKSLNMSDCEMLENIPNTIHKVKSLDTLVLFGCRKITKFPHLRGKIRHLYVTETAIEEVPPRIGNLSCLQTLDFSGSKRLKSLPASISKLKYLETLDLEGCSNLESFPTEICQTRIPLKELYLDGTNIKELPHDFGNLTTLEELHANKTAIEQMPSSFTHLTGLRELALGRSSYKSDGVAFQCPALSKFLCLKCLSLTNLNMLEIPDDLGELDIERLDLSGNDFTAIPASIKYLSKLTRLILNHCKKLQSLPELPCKKLEYLYAHGCVSLETTSQASKHSLQALVLSNCFKLDEDAELLVQHLVSMPGFRVEPRVACLPGSKVPQCFNHQARGPSLTVSLPQRHYIPKFLSFTACIVVAVDGHYNINDLTIGYSCVFRDKSGGEVVHVGSQIVCVGFTGPNVDIESEHLFLFSLSFKGYHGKAKVYDKVSFEFYLKNPKEGPLPFWKVNECGVRLRSWIDLNLDLGDAVEGETTANAKRPTTRDSALNLFTIDSSSSRGENVANMKLRGAEEKLEPILIEKKNANVKRSYEPRDGLSASDDDVEHEPSCKRVKLFKFL